MDSKTYSSLNHATSSASLEVTAMSSSGKQFFGVKISTRIFAIVEILLGIALISMEVRFAYDLFASKLMEFD